MQRPEDFGVDGKENGVENSINKNVIDLGVEEEKLELSIQEYNTLTDSIISIIECIDGVGLETKLLIGTVVVACVWIVWSRN